MRSAVVKRAELRTTHRKRTLGIPSKVVVGVGEVVAVDQLAEAEEEPLDVGACLSRSLSQE